VLPFESLGMVSYLHPIETTAVYMNIVSSGFSRFDTIHEPDRHPATKPAIASPHRSRLCIASRGNKP